MTLASLPDGSADLTRPLVSIVVPALDEAANVPGLLARFAEIAAAHPRYQFELVVVDDGSTDGTAELILAQADPARSTTVVRLARSFGSHYATSAGFEECRGDCAIVLGADLQEPPTLIVEFLARWEAGSQVVWGVRRTRAGGSIGQRLASKSFSLLFTRYANLTNYPPEGPASILADRCVIDEVTRMPEHNRNVLALIGWLGFTQTRVDYDQIARKHGMSRRTKRKMVKLAVDSMIQFSSMPLRLFTFVGIGVALVGLVYAVAIVTRSLIGIETPAGWPTLLVILLVLGGTQLTVIGIMGEYLWRAVEESRRRPLFVVRDVRVAGANQPNAPRTHHGRRAAPIRADPPEFAAPNLGPSGVSQARRTVIDG